MSVNDTPTTRDPRSATAIRDSLLGLAVTKSHVEHECPGTDDLVAWREKRLAPELAGRVESHVAQCERCFETWVELSEALPHRVSAVTGAVHWWQRFSVGGARSPGWQPALAAAAVVVLGLGVVFNFSTITQPSLTPYELSLSGSADWRGYPDDADSDTTVVLTHGDRFELMLRPETAIDDSLEVHVYVGTGAALTPLETPDASELGQGTLSIRGLIGEDILLSSSPSELFVTIGRRGEMPAAGILRERLSGQDSYREKHWQAWKLSIQYVQP